MLVAYGFSRFRFRGRNILFLILLSTIFLPAAVTLIPTYTIFVKLGWVGTWLPLLVPAFFANAYDVFLLRQYFMTLPRELDDAAKIDGAGPLRILTSVILPQSWAVIVAVAVFHIVYTWNLYFEPLLYLFVQRQAGLSGAIHHVREHVQHDELPAVVQRVHGPGRAQRLRPVPDPPQQAPTARRSAGTRRCRASRRRAPK